MTAIGTPRRLIDGSIRFSLSEMTTKEDIDVTLEVLTTIIANLRKLKI